ncbi:hypothetical protein GGU11DRAFT_761013 [Lentinula aff. detonsa]|nr:hypothetical protein GGU11DRAFT_761013 [Lentinula aff. detonsa]
MKIEPAKQSGQGKTMKMRWAGTIAATLKLRVKVYITIFISHYCERSKASTYKQPTVSIQAPHYLPLLKAAHCSIILNSSSRSIMLAFQILVDEVLGKPECILLCPSKEEGSLSQPNFQLLKHLFYNKNNLPSRDLAQSVLNLTHYEEMMKMFNDSFGSGNICWWVIHSAKSGIYTLSVEAFYTMKLEHKIKFRFAYGFPSLSGAFNALLNSSSAPSNMVYDPNSNRAVSMEVLKTVMSNLPQILVHVKSSTGMVLYVAAHDLLIILKKSPEEVEIIESELMSSASLQEFSAQVGNIVPDDIYLGCVWKLYLEAGADVA